MNKRQAGDGWEEAAVHYLEGHGMRILERNFRCRQGEIDIVGQQDGCLCFVEVKYRRDDAFGSALEAVGTRKQMRICRCADYYLYRHSQWREKGVRFDVLAICKDRVQWIRNAFDYRGGGR